MFTVDVKQQCNNNNKFRGGYSVTSVTYIFFRKSFPCQNNTRHCGTGRNLLPMSLRVFNRTIIINSAGLQLTGIFDGNLEMIILIYYAISIESGLNENSFEIQSTLGSSNTDISKYRFISDNIIWMYFLLLFSFQLLLPQLLISQSKFSGTRKFTLRFQKFGMNFDFEISRADCTVLYSIQPA